MLGSALDLNRSAALSLIQNTANDIVISTMQVPISADGKNIQPMALTPERIYTVADSIGTAGKLATLAVLDQTPDEFVSGSELCHRLDEAQGDRPGWEFSGSTRTTAPLSYCTRSLLAAGLVEMGSKEGLRGPIRAAKITTLGSTLWPAVAGTYLPWERRYPDFSLVEVLGEVRGARKRGPSTRLRIFEYLLQRPEGYASTREVQRAAGLSSTGGTAGIVQELCHIGLLESQSRYGPAQRVFNLSSPVEMTNLHFSQANIEVQAIVGGLRALWESGVREVDGSTIVRSAQQLHPELDSRDVWTRFIQWMSHRKRDSFVAELALGDNKLQHTKIRIPDGCKEPLLEFLQLRDKLATDEAFRKDVSVVGYRSMLPSNMARYLKKARRDSHTFDAQDEAEWERTMYECMPLEGASLRDLYYIMRKQTGNNVHEKSFRRRIFTMSDTVQISNKVGQEGVTSEGYAQLRTHHFPRNWRDRAICTTRGLDPELFHPSEADSAAAAETKMKQGVIHCLRCPVRRACLRIAVDHSEPTGVWGGMTADKIQRLSPAQKTNIRASILID